jgi:CBS domain-containing protein
MKIKDFMTEDIIFVDKDQDLQYIIDLMKKHNITKIPVLENKEFIGIITDNIIAHKLGSIRKRGISTSRLHASSVIEKKVEIVSPDEEVKHILKTVGQPGPTMLPVIDKDKLVGVITKADLLTLVKSEISINEIIKKKVITVSSNDRVIHARRLMIDNDVARIPVTKQGKLVGIISDFEIACAFAELKRSVSLGHQKHKLDEMLVNDIMKSPVMWTTHSIKSIDAAKIMIKYNIGSLPVLRDNSLVGIVTRTDLLKTISL